MLCFDLHLLLYAGWITEGEGGGGGKKKKKLDLCYKKIFLKFILLNFAPF